MRESEKNTQKMWTPIIVTNDILLFIPNPEHTGVGGSKISVFAKRLLWMAPCELVSYSSLSPLALIISFNT